MQVQQSQPHQKMKTKKTTTLHLRKSIARSPLRFGFFLAALALTCFALSPMLQAQDQNTRLGFQALDSNTTGDKNTAIGYRAMRDNRAGSENTATGFQALSNNTTGDLNTATGAAALRLNTTGHENTAMGENALRNNISGDSNTAMGVGALGELSTGFDNTAVGHSALGFSTGGANTAVGVSALVRSTGNFNTAVGDIALDSNTTGSHNTALGWRAGDNLTTGDNNIDIGSSVDGVAGESNTIRIGSAQVRTFIKGISGAVVSGAAVVVNAGGQLGVAASSARFKTEIKPMGNASEAILALRPVSFRYKKEIDPDSTPQFGLLAEEVEKVSPAMVARDAQGKVYTVRYDAVNAMLLNEFLKEHRKVQELTKDFRATVAQLTSRLDEQAALIQKVSAQLEASKPAPQLVKNP